MKNLKFLGLLLSIFVVGCDWFRPAEPQPARPTYTQFLECKINGELYTADKPRLLDMGTSLKATYTPAWGGLFISTESDAEEESLGFRIITDMTSTGTYMIDTTNIYDSPRKLKSARLDKSQPYYAEITRIDSFEYESNLKQAIVEGKFSFNLINTSNARDTLKVTDGKFALIWTTRL